MEERLANLEVKFEELDQHIIIKEIKNELELLRNRVTELETIIEEDLADD